MTKRSPEYGILGTSVVCPTQVNYGDWRQVSGYFDGDGSVDFDPGKWVLFPRLSFSDNYRPQLDMLKVFLVSQNVKTWNMFHDTCGAWKFGVAQAESLHIMASMMWPFCFKKRNEMKAILDYLDNKITGSQFVEVLNESVRVGNRTGKIRFLDVPYRRDEGHMLRKIEAANHARGMGMRNRLLNDDEVEEVRRSVISGEATNGELAKKYGVRPATISRAVFGRSKRG